MDRKVSSCLSSSKLTKELLSIRMHYALHLAIGILGNHWRSKWPLYPQENREMKLIIGSKSLEDYPLIENVVLPTYNRRWEKVEKSILSKRKMTLALRKASGSKYGYKWEPNPFECSIKLVVINLSTPWSFLKYHIIIKWQLSLLARKY